MRRRRHLDDHPSLNSSSGVFNSNSLHLSATNSTHSSSRIFPDLDARSGTSNSNIPLTTSATTSTSASVFHSNRTLNAPISPATLNNNNNPLIPRQSLALIQETVQAVGTGGNSEMHSGVQFSLPSSYQAHVAAATTLSQGGLGHNQNTSNVHLSIPGQAQAHSNTHPVQINSEAHVAAQMQGHQFPKLKIEDALSYLDQVKYIFGNQPQVYNDFLDIMKEFKSQSTGILDVIQRVSNLFRGHPELIVGFNTYLPLGYRIEVQPNEQVQVRIIPGTNLASGGTTGSTSLTILPSGPPTTTPTHTCPGNAANEAYAHVAPQMQGHQFPKLKIEDALSFLDQVKYKFGNQPQVYNGFMDIMIEFKSQSIDTDGVIRRVLNLFRGHPELIVGFNTFLPPGYEIQFDEQVQDSIPGTNLASGGTTGSASLSILTSGPPTTTPTHTSSGNAANKVMEHKTRLVPDERPEASRDMSTQTDSNLEAKGQQSSDECVICYEGYVNCAFNPCGHMSCCYNCAVNLWNSNSHCPMCRKSIGYILKIYK